MATVNRDDNARHQRAFKAEKEKTHARITAWITHGQKSRLDNLCAITDMSYGEVIERALANLNAKERSPTTKEDLILTTKDYADNPRDETLYCEPVVIEHYAIEWPTDTYCAGAGDDGVLVASGN